MVSFWHSLDTPFFFFFFFFFFFRLEYTFVYWVVLSFDGMWKLNTRDGWIDLASVEDGVLDI